MQNLTNICHSNGTFSSKTILNTQYPVLTAVASGSRCQGVVRKVYESAVLLTVFIMYSSLLETEICSTLLCTSAFWSLYPMFLRQVIDCTDGGFCDLTKSHRDAGADP
jgi:hypothetical protein